LILIWILQRESLFVPFSQPQVATVNGYPIEPTRELTRILKLVKGEINFQKGLLHEVLGILEVANSVITKGMDSLTILFHQLTKRFYVTIKASFYQWGDISLHEIFSIFIDAKSLKKVG
jgi:hypothetical protein